MWKRNGWNVSKLEENYKPANSISLQTLSGRSTMKTIQRRIIITLPKTSTKKKKKKHVEKQRHMTKETKNDNRLLLGKNANKKQCAMYLEN